MTEKSKPKVIAVVGPTASGKTSYAIDLAKKLDTEIISADSRLVYKGFDIGCAKPTAEEMQGIRHHLIDVVEPDFDYSVSHYCKAATSVIDSLHQEGKTPIVAGGTGLYFRILLEDFAPPKVAPNFELRAELEDLSVDELYKMLESLDLESAKKIHPNNKVKIIRAIEVSKALGVAHSDAMGKKEVPYDVEWLGLNAHDRAFLYERVDRRVLEMVDMGIVEETQSLLDKYGCVNNIVKTIGYQEITEYLDSNLTLDEVIALIQKNTRNYAKRQLTWFRRNKDTNWVYID